MATTTGHDMTTDTDTTNFNTERTITLSEHDWLSISTALRLHAMTQGALGWTNTAERARRLADLIQP
jgi:hypothetical protein